MVTKIVRRKRPRLDSTIGSITLVKINKLLALPEHRDCHGKRGQLIDKLILKEHSLMTDYGEWLKAWMGHYAGEAEYMAQVSAAFREKLQDYRKRKSELEHRK